MPSSYGYQPSMIDLILNRGRIAAEGAQQSGDIWGRTVSGLGQLATDTIQHVQQANQVAKRDRSWLAYVNSGEWAKDPQKAYVATQNIWGPDEAPKHFQGIMGVAQLMNKERNPEADGKAAGALIRSADSMTPAGRAAAYPQLAKLVKGAYPDLPIDPQYSEEKWADIRALAPALLGEKAAEPKTVQVKTRNADGSETVRFVEEKPGQEFSSAAAPLPKHMVTVPGPNGQPVQRLATEAELTAGVPSYQKPDAPKAPAEPKWQQGEDADGNPILYDVVSGAVKPFPSGVTPKAGAAEGGRIAGAKAALEASSEIHQYLSRKDVKDAIGPLMGRYNSLAQAAGVGDPVATELVGMLKSYAAMQPNIHGFRAVHFASDIEKLLTTKQTTANLEAALRGIDTAAINVRDRGRHPSGATAPAAPPIVQKNDETGEYRHSIDGGKTWISGKP